MAFGRPQQQVAHDHIQVVMCVGRGAETLELGLLIRTSVMHRGYTSGAPGEDNGPYSEWCAGGEHIRTVWGCDEWNWGAAVAVRTRMKCAGSRPILVQPCERLNPHKAHWQPSRHFLFCIVGVVHAELLDKEVVHCQSSLFQVVSWGGEIFQVRLQGLPPFHLDVRRRGGRLS